MNSEQEKRYKQQNMQPVNQVLLQHAAEAISVDFTSLRTFQTAGNLFAAQERARAIFGSIALIDRMGRATGGEVEVGNRIMGENDIVRATLEEEIQNSDAVGDNERVLELIRVGHLLGYTDTEPKGVQRIFAALDGVIPGVTARLYQSFPNLQPPVPQASKDPEYILLFNKHTQELAAKRAAAGATAGTGAPGSPDWLPEDITGKGAAWMEAVHDIEAGWNAIIPPPPDDISPASEFIRLTEGFNLLHREVALQSVIGTAGPRLQAMIENLIPRIWLTPQYFEEFFRDEWRPGNPADPNSVAELDDITQAVLIPEAYRGLTTPLNDNGKRGIQKIWRYYLFALHQDKTAANPDTNKNLDNQRMALIKAINVAWPPIKDNLVK